MIKDKSTKLEAYMEVGVTRLFTDLIHERFGKEILELEDKISAEILDSIKLFPKAQLGYIRNRLKVTLNAELRLIEK